MGNALNACSTPLDACGYRNTWPTSDTLNREEGQQPVSARNLKPSASSPPTKWGGAGNRKSFNGDDVSSPGLDNSDEFWDETTRYQGPLTEDWDDEATENDLLTQRSDFDHSEMSGYTPRKVSWMEEPKSGNKQGGSTMSHNSQDTWAVHEREVTNATWSLRSKGTSKGGSSLADDEEYRRRMAAKSRKFLQKWDQKNSRAQGGGASKTPMVRE